jgi:hypothetical protein
MRRVALGVAGLCLAAGTLSGSAPAQAPAGDSASGSGHVLLTDFVGSGTAGPNGENPTGSLTVSGYLNFTATVTCSNTSGNALVAGHRIENGPRAGQGFLTSSVDNGPPVKGRPVDLTVYSGYLRKPPVNCPSPGDPPPRGFISTGGGPFTSGDLTVVDAKERLPAGAPAARITEMRLAMRPRRLAGRRDGAVLIRVRVCGQPGIALVRLSLTSSPAGHDVPVGVRVHREVKLRHTGACRTHRVEHPLEAYPAGRRYRVMVRARTTGRRWSGSVTRQFDAYR